jgi:hypothetical protein
MPEHDKTPCSNWSLCSDSRNYYWWRWLGYYRGYVSWDSYTEGWYWHIYECQYQSLLRERYKYATPQEAMLACNPLVEKLETAKRAKE